MYHRWLGPAWRCRDHAHHALMSAMVTSMAWQSGNWSTSDCSDNTASWRMTARHTARSLRTSSNVRGESMTKIRAKCRFFSNWCVMASACTYTLYMEVFCFINNVVFIMIETSLVCRSVYSDWHLWFPHCISLNDVHCIKWSDVEVCMLCTMLYELFPNV